MRICTGKHSANQQERRGTLYLCGRSAWALEWALPTDVEPCTSYSVSRTWWRCCKRSPCRRCSWGRTNPRGGPEGDQNSVKAELQAQMKSLQSFWKQQRYRLVRLCINCFCSYGSQERFRQTGRRLWSYHFTRGKVQEPPAAVTGQFHCCQCRSGFNGRPLVQWPTGPQVSDVMGAPGIG